jgi:hypothetical protein
MRNDEKPALQYAEQGKVESGTHVSLPARMGAAERAWMRVGCVMSNFAFKPSICGDEGMGVRLNAFRWAVCSTNEVHTHQSRCES